MIVTCSTENYSKWLFLFLKALTRFTKKITVFLVNYKKENSKRFIELFPGVTFIEEKLDLERKEGFKNAYKITYLKGYFLEKAFREEPVLWIDCTALFRSDPGLILDQLRTNSAVLNRRDFDHDYGKAVYAAEIFGFKKLDDIKFYKQKCQEKKEEWFADQLSLCEITCDKAYIPFGTYSNFYYDTSAKSWSDRGRHGNGINSKDDEDFTIEKYLGDLEKDYPTIRQDFLEFNKRDKLKILVHVDASGWCYHNTVMKITDMLKDKFEFVIINDAQRQASEVINFDGDIVWARCGAYRNFELKNLNPGLIKKTFSSVTTGGELLYNRAMRNLSCNENECGVIVQNEEAKIVIEDILNGKRDQSVYVLPNGCDIEMFKPAEKEGFIIGFNGRVKNTEENLKGYNYFRLATKNEETLELTGDTCWPYEKMPEFYDKIKILILPSSSEGCSNTINEALSSGVPVLTVKTGWHAEVCNGEQDGVIWISRNVKDIKDKIDYVRNLSKEAYAQLSENARNWAVRHSWENLKSLYEDSFNSMFKDTLKPKTSKASLGYLRVRAIKDTIIGQLDNTGENFFLKKGEIRELPYNDRSKSIISRYVRGRFLQVIN